MRYEIEAGTDAGSLLLFDPASLPADFERRFPSDSVELLERLTRVGHAFWINTDGDGAYLLHAYVDEPDPESSLGITCTTRRECWTFMSPRASSSSRVRNMRFANTPAFLEQHPHMGGSMAIHPGTYHLTVYRTAYPEGLLEDQFRSMVSAGEYRLWRSMTILVPLAIAAWIGLIVIYFTTARVPNHQYLSPVLALIFAVPFVVVWSRPYRSLKRRFRRLQREFPAFVARLDHGEPLEGR